MTADVLEMDALALRAEVVRLRSRLRILGAVVGLLVARRRENSRQGERQGRAGGAQRTSLIAAIERSRAHLSLRSALRVVGVSPSAYHSWTREGRHCDLAHQDEACPRSHPARLTDEEVAHVREMAIDERYRHVPTSRLAVLAQRMGRVYASTTTWYRLVRGRQWSRERHRRHPKPPRIGVRGERPDQVWHVDTSVVRLVDGTKVWLHAVIDNFSRRILAWRLADRFDIVNAVDVLREAVEGAVSAEEPPQVVADGGIENFNAAVDGLVETGLLERVRALVDVRFSNSMIESFWSSMKHQWLFQHRLETPAAVRRLVAFYVTEHNSKIPHAAFDGQTPDEMYYGTGEGVPLRLRAARDAARSRRLVANRAVRCDRCRDVCPTSGSVAA